MSDQIHAKWYEIPNSRGLVYLSNGQTLLSGTYIKYDNYTGSMTLTDAQGNIVVWRIAAGVHSIHNVTSSLEISGAHTVYVVFGTNSGSTVATGFIPFNTTGMNTFVITNIDIAGIGAGINLASLEIAGIERLGINLRATATYASQFKGNTAVIKFTVT